MNTPGLPQLDEVVEELAALAERRPAVRPKIRARLIQTASVGGARPKTTVRDDQGDYWLVKPALASDFADIPLLEHVAQQWGAASGLDFAATAYHPAAGGRSAVRVLRFDRSGNRRHMCVSAASLLQTEYPGVLRTDRWSYPRLAEQLQLVGAPVEDRIELFGRMVFNAVCGNDDDHVRNHAIVYRFEERGERKSAAGGWRRPSTWCPIRLKRRRGWRCSCRRDASIFRVRRCWRMRIASVLPAAMRRATISTSCWRASQRALRRWRLCSIANGGMSCTDGCRCRWRCLAADRAREKG